MSIGQHVRPRLLAVAAEAAGVGGGVGPEEDFELLLRPFEDVELGRRRPVFGCLHRKGSVHMSDCRRRALEGSYLHCGRLG